MQFLALTENVARTSPSANSFIFLSKRKIMSVSAIILSAGFSSRMGCAKALLNYHGKTFLENICENIPADSIKQLIIVKNPILSFNKISRLKNNKISFAVNPQPENGMLSSFRCGLRALDSLSENVMLCLVDHPAVKKTTYEKLISQAENNKIIIPTYNARRGHPVIFGTDFLTELLTGDCPQGAKSVVRRHQNNVKKIQVDDQGVLLDIDTPAEAKNAGVTL